MKTKQISGRSERVTEGVSCYACHGHVYVKPVTLWIRRETSSVHSEYAIFRVKFTGFLVAEKSD